MYCAAWNNSIKSKTYDAPIMNLDWVNRNFIRRNALRIWTPLKLQFFCAGFRFNCSRISGFSIGYRRTRAIMESARLLQIALAAFSFSRQWAYAMCWCIKRRSNLFAITSINRNCATEYNSFYFNSLISIHSTHFIIYFPSLLNYRLQIRFSST